MNTELTQDIIRQLKADHAGVQLHKITNAKLEFVARPPTEAEFKRWEDTVKDDPLAGAELVNACILWPEREPFRALCEKKPAIVISLGEKILEIAGFDKAARVELL
jgi:hypothetical protein